ncbi:hypothetical protein HanPSC8_Chr17g0789951 [Helianthus annuus]|nr:hypothetical protein HanPSC8_Chr17g0789951 [Helianthus annuus]
MVVVGGRSGQIYGSVLYEDSSSGYGVRTQRADKQGLLVFAIGVGLSAFDKASVHYYLQSHIQINEFYRGVRDLQLIGLSGYIKEGLLVSAIGVGLSTFDKASPRAENLKIAAYRTLLGHTASVQSVAAQPTANMVCSGSTQYELKKE